MNNVVKLTTNTLFERFNKLKEPEQEMAEMAAKALLKAMSLRDPYSHDHCIRVCYFSLMLGEELGLSTEELYDLQFAAVFHDLGKVGSPDAVINKATRLNDLEFKMIQKHPQHASDILSSFPIFSKAAEAVKHHHERYDGRGYPDCLKGETIPYLARIVTVTDTFDSMTSERMYRKPFPKDIALNELKEFAGAQFDPHIVNTFIDLLRDQDINGPFDIPLFGEQTSDQFKKVG